MAQEKGGKVDYDFAAHERPLFDAWKEGGYFARSKGKGAYADHPYTIGSPRNPVSNLQQTTGVLLSDQSYRNPESNFLCEL